LEQSQKSSKTDNKTRDRFEYLVLVACYHVLYDLFRWVIEGVRVVNFSYEAAKKDYERILQEWVNRHTSLSSGDRLEVLRTTCLPQPKATVTKPEETEDKFIKLLEEDNKLQEIIFAFAFSDTEGFKIAQELQRYIKEKLQ
jgi:hypothetical protein